MQQVKWFKRKFDFSYQQNIFPAIVERLKGTAIRLEETLKYIPVEHQSVSLNDTWSILENIGHLLDLEPLWQGRLSDFLEKRAYLRDADLQNNKTHQAEHNKRSANDLIRDFTVIRTGTIEQLENLSETAIYATAIHPRLKQPMRMMDLFLFVAEHDDHHLARISEIKKKLEIRTV